ncbi:tetratricopeptide repeat protein [Trinickia fusca]|uniref:Tetratricopeptide repeat protein n=2 Tax=Trinickia fusca TaxID=2419777 RepID=A0A494X990_9BURK|nr:tetratricopeptide repeat protein [Trinickia fusca]RKP47020.1 tetratricopeptide repeat protein [Trinickia fusca]
MAVLARYADLCLQAGQGGSIVDWLERLASQPVDGHRWRNNLAAILFQQQRHEEALHHLRLLTAAEPGYGSGWRNLLAMLRQLDHDDEYRATVLEAFRRHPGRIEFLVAYAQLGEDDCPGSGIPLLREGWRSAKNGRHTPEEADTVAVALARAAWRLGLDHERIDVLSEAAARGAFSHRLYEWEARKRAACHAVAGHYPTLRELPQVPNWVPWELALALLSDERWQDGFATYESRLLWWGHDAGWTDEQVDRVWRGENLSGKTVLVMGEQGYGDQMQFLRFAPRLKALGAAKVVFGTNRPLARLAATVAGVDDVIAFGDSIPAFDWHVPLCSLPHRLGVAGSADFDFAAEPYIRVPDALCRAWCDRVSSQLVPHRPSGARRLRVGLCWAGKHTHVEDARRSLSFDSLRPLIDRFAGTIDWVRVQPGLSEDTQGICCADRGVRDFLDLAGLLAGLDLLITIDSAPVHVAGAMGLPVWLLNRRFGDWRWPARQSGSRWYGLVRVFHQSVADDWRDPIERIARELTHIVTRPIAS